jgi:hypothetical protein
MNDKISVRYCVPTNMPISQTKVLTCIACLILGLPAQAISQTEVKTSPYLKHAVISETAGMIHIDGNSPRPLAQVLDALQQKHGWVVGYEDPRFMSKLDLKEDPENHPASSTTTYLPGGGKFSIEYPDSLRDEETIVRRLVDVYNASANPGRFELRKGTQDILFVVGTQARNLHGQVSHQRSVFDVSITVAKQKRTASDTIKLICQKMTEQSRITVRVGVTPRNVLAHTQVTVGGSKIAARELLLQTLISTRRGLYWRLLFDPSTRVYFLNIHSI